MDLIAIDDGLAVLIGRHQGGEAAEGTSGALNENVAQIRGLHLGELLGRFPADRGRLVVLPTRLLDEIKAGFEVAGPQVRGPRQTQPVPLLCPRVRPMCPVFFIYIFFRPLSSHKLWALMWRQQVLSDEDVIVFAIYAFDGVHRRAPPLGTRLCAVHAVKALDQSCDRECPAHPIACGFSPYCQTVSCIDVNVGK